jgi:hypothetical protein
MKKLGEPPSQHRDRAPQHGGGKHRHYYILPLTQKVERPPIMGGGASMAEASTATTIHAVPVVRVVYSSGGACLRHAGSSCSVGCG